MNKSAVKKLVKNAYGRIAASGGGCGGGCCTPDTKQFAKSIGYSDKDLKAVPQGANLGLSCGNPTALAGLKKGETVLDLGSGAGLDCFIAAKKVGAKGKVVGVDMTPEMIAKSRNNAAKSGIKNVEFRLGEIESLPVADNSVNAVISNCVINLSADKQKVFREIYRVLKPGGRISISDMALLKELPAKIQRNLTAYVGCVSGAILIGEYEKLLRKAGLKGVKLTIKGSSDCITPDTKDPMGRLIMDTCGDSVSRYIVSVYAEGRK